MKKYVRTKEKPKTSLYYIEEKFFYVININSKIKLDYKQ